MQADNAEAKAGVQKVIAALEARVTKALAERDAQSVVSAWTALQRAAPDHPQLDALRSQLLALSRTLPKTPDAKVANTSRSRAIAPDAAAPAVAANVPVVTPPAASIEAARIEAALAEKELADAIARELAEQEAAAAAPVEQVAEAPALQGPSIAEEVEAVVRLRERGALLAPLDANAFDSLMELRTRHPDAEEVRSEQQRLAFILLDRARTALAANNIDDADTFVDKANTLAPGMSAIRALQEQVAAAQKQRDFTQNVVQAASLKRTREVAAVYPRDAAREGTEGWVQVEFTIAPDGSTQNLQVLNSKPADIFDRAALDSVSKWRFEPIRENGEPVSKRAVLQVRFVLNN